MDEQMMKKIALFRYALIAPLINGTFQGESKSQYYRDLSKKKYELPNGREVMYAPGTFKSWYLLYKQKGFDGLYPKTRNDIGMTRTLDNESKQRIHELKEKYPYITATMVHQKLLEEGYISVKSTSLTTITRYIARNNLKSKQLAGKERKSFAFEKANDCWQADTSHTIYLTEKGKKRKVYLILFLDDASRLVVGFDFFYEDSAVNVQKVFKKAIATYGIPKRLYVDNGSSYANQQLSLICAMLGVVLIHTKPYDAQAKGKVERIFRTIKDQWMRAADYGQFHTLEDVRISLEEYLRKKYQNKVHSALKMSPKDRYITDQNEIRYIDEKTLEDGFLHTENRKVRNDATITLNRQMYEVPQKYIGMMLKIKYDPSNLEELYIYEDNMRKESVYMLQRVDNSKVKRKYIDFSMVEDDL
ncbi:Mu transposase-like protein [Breznakia blatticola]|uniref:Mu transposase-like protein n=1 Tax=Breznakia blatticola TaxID=1754012 RepID=A0A4R7ZBT8_9FIRM|nr:DDE-type integrase/transposase/recombinase [Breznakia blatticola]TDW08040.1 Mu transposase-like protein [Breznakia blatticola]